MPKDIHTRSEQAIQKRLKEAQKDLEKMLKEIEPFAIEKDEEIPSTQGKWMDTSAFDNILKEPSDLERKIQVNRF